MIPIPPPGGAIFSTDAPRILHRIAEVETAGDEPMSD